MDVNDVDQHEPAAKSGARRVVGRDWSSWPQYNAATEGVRGYWYPLTWSTKVTVKPRAEKLCGDRILLMRDAGTVYAMSDRCPHRGVPLSLGVQEFPGTITCPYHAWTYELETGRLCAVLTDGPGSPITGRVIQKTYPVEEFMGLVWVYMGDGEVPHPLRDQLPEEWLEDAFVMGCRIDDRRGNWRYATENGFDEGHAKYLHRKALWRLFRAMPTWNITKLVTRGRWVYRVQEEMHWRDEYPGLGQWTNIRWWKSKPKEGVVSNIGNVGELGKQVNPIIGKHEFPGFTSISMPGTLRVVYHDFIHYEYWVPIDADNHRYVGIMIQFRKGLSVLPFFVKYFAAIRWLFHGQFSNEDAWMVDVTDAPPERLYRPDSSLTSWRKLFETTTIRHDDERRAKPRRQEKIG